MRNTGVSGRPKGHILGRLCPRVVRFKPESPCRDLALHTGPVRGVSAPGDPRTDHGRRGLPSPPWSPPSRGSTIEGPELRFSPPPGAVTMHPLPLRHGSEIRASPRGGRKSGGWRARGAVLGRGRGTCRVGFVVQGHYSIIILFLFCIMYDSQ